MSSSPASTSPAPIERARAPIKRGYREPGPIVIEIENVTKLYKMGEEVVHALCGVALTVRRNEYLAIMGPSGSGKSTMMNMLGCLDTPTSGKYHFTGKDVSTMSDDELADIRNREIGFVFQTFNLLPRSSSLQNVELPLIYAGFSPSQRRERATQTLRNVGLGDRMTHKPNELSGGQRQRVAIARAFIRNPDILLLDEATSSLDSESEKLIQDALETLLTARTAIIIAHRLATVRKCDRIYVLDAGCVTESGTHEELILKPGGTYRRLAEMQFAG